MDAVIGDGESATDKTQDEQLVLPGTSASDSDSAGLAALSVCIPAAACNAAEECGSKHASVGLLSTAPESDCLTDFAPGSQESSKQSGNTASTQIESPSTWTSKTTQVEEEPVERFEVYLRRSSQQAGFGVQVAAYSGFVDAKPFSGIYVKQVVPDSPAALSNASVDDRIVAVNSIDISALSNEHAIRLLRQQLRDDLCCVLVLERRPVAALLDSLRNQPAADPPPPLPPAPAPAPTLPIALPSSLLCCSSSPDRINTDDNRNLLAPLCRFERDGSIETVLPSETVSVHKKKQRSKKGCQIAMGQLALHFRKQRSTVGETIGNCCVGQPMQI